MADCNEESTSTGARKKHYPTPPLKQYEGEYHTAGEYAAALRVWLNQLYQWQCVAATFPYFLASVQAQAAVQSNIGNTPASPSPSQQQDPRPQTETPAQPPADQANDAQTQQQPLPQRGVEYVIPPLWKRLVAEAVDFFLLFVVKLAVTFAAVDAFGLMSDAEKFDFENLTMDFVADYKMALEMTSEILVLELIHRIGTCVFEALCLHRGTGGTGGATPGKKLVGLRVVRCEWVAPTGAEQAVVYPASDLGLGRAILRSVVKNFSLTFLFPICFFLFSFQHNRTVYDIIAGSIVVEEQAVVRRRNGNDG
ncbi:protein FAM8A1-like isoform X1 [Macrobrachium nipponense]|uniref:protein FAM8A1-like isoform X1 n=1 Tax=Macrobrachium nipponense TaxID=159736 RepID=UPI0030C7D57F